LKNSSKNRGEKIPTTSRPQQSHNRRDSGDDQRDDENHAQDARHLAALAGLNKE
jgi:hypothetical protein